MSSKVRVFVPTDLISDGKAIIKDGDANHITRVMRQGIGDVITVCDMKRNVYDGTIISVAENMVECTIELTEKKDVELPCNVTVYQGVPKGDKLELVIQKSVELGATQIVPVLCDRCVSRPDKKSAVSKNARYQKIAESAACQSGRLIIPQVSLMISFDEMLRIVKKKSENTVFFACYEGEDVVKIKDVLEAWLCEGKVPSEIAFFIGPEGGISEKEMEKLKEFGFKSVTLGKRILRTETAPLYVLSAISVLVE